MRILACALLIGVMGSPVAAQTSASPPQRVWLSAGAGPADVGLALTASASYSRGPAVLIARLDGAGQWSETMSSKALLIGARTPKNSRFALAAMGIGRAGYTAISDNGVVMRHVPPRPVLVFELKAQTGLEVSQWGLSILGVVGPEPTRYIGAAVTLNLGWFGPEPS